MLFAIRVYRFNLSLFLLHFDSSKILSDFTSDSHKRCGVMYFNLDFGIEADSGKW